MKDIKIKVDGTSNNYSNTAEIVTEVIPYGTAAWVPADEVQTADLEVETNGTYIASDDGYYGYASADIDVPTGREVTGKDPVTGKTYTVSLDDDGNIVRTLVGD